MKKILKIKINDEVISEKNNSDAYIKTFNLLYKKGLITEEISTDFPSYVKTEKSNWASIDKREDAFLIENSQNLYPSTHSSTDSKKNELQKIFDHYQIVGKIEITGSKESVSIPKIKVEINEITDNYVNNKLAQTICVIGDSGVGKSYRINKTLENEKHKTLFIIVDNMWQNFLFDYSPIDRNYRLTKAGEFIKKAYTDPANCYTIVIDECHKNLEIINDSLLQAISKKRNDGVRFLSLNSLVDEEFNFLPEFKGNRVLPDNLGFLFISSKSDIIEGNDDLNNRIEIIKLDVNDQADKNYTIDYLLSKIKEEEESEYSN